MTVKESASPALSPLFGSLLRGISARVALGAVILVHGAGSFGHGAARRLGVSSALGWATTASQVRRLNGLVVEGLVELGVPALGISMFPWAGAGGSEEEEAVWREVRCALDAGLVPVLHGDVLSGGRILSGDTIMEMLCRAFSPQRAVFCTDVEGVFTADPKKDPSAKLIPVLKVGQGGIEFSEPTDATGGFETKIREACSIARSGIEVVIVSASEYFLAGECGGGTKLVV